MSDPSSPQNSSIGYPATTQARWALGVFCLAALISYTDRLILSALVDPIRHDLAISDSQIGLLQGPAFAGVYIISGLFLGRLADTRHRLTIMIAGSILWCVGTVLCGFVSSIWELFGARLFVGIGEASLAPAVVSIISDIFPPSRRGAAVGIFIMGTIVGAPVSIGVGGLMLGVATEGLFSALPLIGVLAPWRIVLVLVGLGGLVVPALLTTLLEPVRRGRAQGVSLTGVHRYFVSNRRILWPLYLGMGMLCIGDYGTMAWIPTLLSRRFHLDPGDIGILFGLVTAIAGVAGSLSGGVLSDRAAQSKGIRGRLMVSCISAATAAAGAVLIRGDLAGWVLLGLGVWTFASAVAAVSGIAALQEIVPNEYRGSSMSIVAFCNTSLGLGFGPTLIAIATERIYGNPLALGIATMTVALPGALIAALLFTDSRRVL